jgi:hypothetical protein
MAFLPYSCLMTAQEEFLAEIEAFLSRTGMAPSTLGLRAVNNGKLVAQVRADDRSITLKTVDRVRAFMATHDDASRAA